MDDPILKEVVKRVMKSDHMAEVNDKWLIIAVLREMGFKIYVDYADINKIPSFESITRCKRKINEEERIFRSHAPALAKQFSMSMPKNTVEVFTR